MPARKYFLLQYHCSFLIVICKEKLCFQFFQILCTNICKSKCDSVFINREFNFSGMFTCLYNILPIECPKPKNWIFYQLWNTFTFFFPQYKFPQWSIKCSPLSLSFLELFKLMVKKHIFKKTLFWLIYVIILHYM